MTFKNAMVYTLSGDLPMDELIEELLQENAFTPVHESQYSSKGWVPLTGVDALLFTANDASFFRLRTDTKVLKNSAISREVEDRANAIEKQEERKVGKREKQEIKEAIITAHLPTALVDSGYTVGFIDHNNDRIIIDAGSAKVAEDFLDCLRKTIGSLKVRPLAVEVSPTGVMTDALYPDVEDKTLIHDFLLGEKCSMNDLEGAKAKFSDIDLTDEYVTNHITQGGMSVDSLALSIPDRLTFVLTDALILKNIKFLDGFQTDVLDAEPEDADLDAGLSYLRTTTFLVVAELRELVQKVIDAHGGEAENFDPMDGL